MWSDGIVTPTAKDHQFYVVGFIFKFIAHRVDHSPHRVTGLPAMPLLIMHMLGGLSRWRGLRVDLTWFMQISSIEITNY